MATDIWLSILLPVYNVESYLAECVQSLLKQIGDDEGVQIIIVDDASTDRCREIAESFCSQYPRCVKVVCNEVNQGVSASRNRLINEATGKYVWFVDPDDYVLAGALIELRTIIDKYAPDLILCDYRKSRFATTRSFYGRRNQLSTDIGQLVAGVFKSRKLYCWIKISRRTLWIKDPRFPDGKIFEDIATTPWLLLKARHFYYTPSAWIYYRRHSGSIMGSLKQRAGNFDVRKHQDLAEALTGFKEALHLRGSELPPSAAYYVSDFIAKEFIKTGFRFRRIKDAQVSVGLEHYRERFEKCAPIRFDNLAIEYLKRLRLIRYVLLKYVQYLAEKSQRSAEGDSGRAR